MEYSKKSMGQRLMGLFNIGRGASGGAMQLDRRAMLAGMLAAPMALAAAGKKEEDPFENLGSATKKLTNPALERLKGTMPKGKIGNLEISRLVFGSNLIGGYAHSRDLIYVPQLFKEYNTEAKVFETLHLAEMAGINTMVTPSHELPLIKKYKDEDGGAIQTVVQTYPSKDDYKTDVDKAIANGGTTFYVQGGVADGFISKGDIDTIANTVAHIKSQGFLAGVGGHSIRTVMACEEKGVGADYYVKTCHHDHYWSAHPKEKRVEFSVIGPGSDDHNEYHDNMFDLFPEETVAFMEKVDKPWIGFKVLAGGAIHPKDGFRYAFENGADFICVGAFDFQVVEDVNIAVEVLDGIKERKRPWRA